MTATPASSYASAVYAGTFALRSRDGVTKYVVGWERDGEDKFRLTVRQPTGAVPFLSAVRSGSAGVLCSQESKQVCYVADEFARVFGGDAEVVRLRWSEQATVEEVLDTGMKAFCYLGRSERECFSDRGVPLFSSGPIAKSVTLLAATTLTAEGLHLDSSLSESGLELVAITVDGAPAQDAFEIERDALPFPGIVASR